MADETTGALSLPGNDGVMPSQAQMAAVSTPAPQVTNPATDTSKASPSAAPEDKSWHGQSFLGKMFSPLVNAAGHDRTTKVDDNGQVTTDITQAAPGTMFKHMLTGALSGLAAATQKRGVGFGGGLGLGFEGAQQQQQEQDDRQRQQAIQAAQLKQQAQKAQDEHGAAQDESHLRGAEVAYNNAQVAQLGFNMSKQSQEFQDKVIEQQTQARDYFKQNGGQLAGQGLTYEELQQRMAADKSLTHSLHGFLTGESPVMDSDGKQVMEPATDPKGNPILDASTGKPVMRPKMSYTFDLMQAPDDHALTKADIKRYKDAGIQGFDQGQVKPGQTIAGSRWFNLENQYQTKQLSTLSVDEKKASIMRDKAAAAAESERAKDLIQDISNKKDRQQATKSWGEALSAANNDTAKAVELLKQKDPKSFSLLAGAESVDYASNGETETVSSPDGTTKTVMKKQRIFSSPQKIIVTGPKGTFSIDPSQLDTFKANGYTQAGEQQAKNPQQQQGSEQSTMDSIGSNAESRKLAF